MNDGHAGAGRGYRGRPPGDVSPELTGEELRA